MGRIMALDYGVKRIGLATTDPLQLIASPLDTVKTADIFDFFEQYLKTEIVDCLVVGQPFHKDGSLTNLENHIKGFIKQFSKQYPDINIVRQNEFLTSKMAPNFTSKSL